MIIWLWTFVVAKFWILEPYGFSLWHDTARMAFIMLTLVTRSIGWPENQKWFHLIYPTILFMVKGDDPLIIFYGLGLDCKLTCVSSGFIIIKTTALCSYHSFAFPVIWHRNVTNSELLMRSYHLPFCHISVFRSKSHAVFFTVLNPPNQSWLMMF